MIGLGKRIKLRTMGTVELIELIASIASIVLSIVAIVISVLFYILGKEDSKEIREKAQKIETQTGILNILFERMFSTSFDMIRENSRVMQTYLLNSVGQTNDTQNESSSVDSQDSSTKVN